MSERIRDGDLYKVVTIDHITFEIRYGYESPETKAKGWEPTPIYPDFSQSPQYTPEGYPFVTVYQEVCEHHKPKEAVSGEDWCADCEWLEQHEAYIGICKCPLRRVRKNE